MRFSEGYQRVEEETHTRARLTEDLCIARTGGQTQVGDNFISKLHRGLCSRLVSRSNLSHKSLGEFLRLKLLMALVVLLNCP